MRDALYLLAIVTGALLFFAPTILAHARRHRYRWPITALNLVLGITGIGWLAALIWSVWPQPAGEPAPTRLIKN